MTNLTIHITLADSQEDTGHHGDQHASSGRVGEGGNQGYLLRISEPGTFTGRENYLKYS